MKYMQRIGAKSVAMAESIKCKKPADNFYGTVTVGERGQIVIPAEARRDMEIATGDKLIVFGGPDKHHLMICKSDDMMAFLESMIEGLKMANRSPIASNTEVTGDNT